MTTLISVRDLTGRMTRRCDAICHDADPTGACTCVCGGRFHGIGSEAAAAVTWETLNRTRAEAPVEAGEHVQLRIGA